MQTKLTLRLDEALIRRAKAYGRKSGKSVSRIVADFFATLGEPVAPRDLEITPKVRSLIGALGDAEAAESEYREYLEQKFC